VNEGGRGYGQIAKKVGKWAALALGLGLVLGALAIFLTIHHYEGKLPSLSKVRSGYQPPQVTRVLARDGTLLASLFTERRTVIPLSELPNHVKLAFLAAEDAGFYQHQGLNYFGMLRALAANLRAGRTRQGASTITQQVVKNVLLDAERSYERKIKETILARRLERELSKDEIFGLYLNQIYLGHGRYGVEEAARYYFGKQAKELDLAEAALLAGLVAAPERYSPRHDEARAVARRRYVLGQMLDKGFVTADLFAEARDAPVRLAPPAEGESELAPEVVAYVKRELEAAAGESAARGGFVVETSIDPVLQAAARRALRENLDAFAVRHKLVPPFTKEEQKSWGPVFAGAPKPNKIYVGRVAALDDANQSVDVRVGDALGRVALNREERYNPKGLPPSQFTKVGAVLRVGVLQAPPTADGLLPLRLELGPESALVAIDPRTREILALVGGYEPLMGGLDRATQARRQPGSAFKPFVYGYALHSRRVSPATVLELVPPAKRGASKHAPAGEPYRISVRAAITASDNAAATRLLEEVGAPNVIEWARALGIESRLEPTPSLALGAYEVTPLEITNAFATFASGGEFEAPRLIRKIAGGESQSYEPSPRPPKRRVMQPDEAYLVTSLLRSVVEAGTGKRAKVLNRPLAGKTGTTNLAKDAWFVGYSTDIVAGVWVGYDDALPLGPGESGAVTALPAWIAFMKAAHERRAATEFPRPGSIVVVAVDPATGLLAPAGQTDAIEEEFLEGTAPSDFAQPDGGALHAGAPDPDGLADDETRLSHELPDEPSGPVGPVGDPGAEGGTTPPEPPAADDAPPPF
jgi:penicillin-binding protein 1A